MKLTSWGNYPVIESTVKSPRSETVAVELLEAADTVIGRGLGRSYGDSALNEQLVLSSSRFNAMESFDEESGLLVAEAGVSLAEILEAFLPRGWFLPVTPGTKFITLGGAIASDVHGKNHHQAGTFSQHIAWCDIWTPAMGIVRCSPDEHSDIFYATAGGHGLTGFIIRAALRLTRIPSGFIAQESIKSQNLAGIMELFEEHSASPFSVAWIDCLQSGKNLGRSIFMGGRFAGPEELPPKLRPAPYQIPVPRKLAVPCNFPSFALNTWSVKAFNALYHGKTRQGKSEAIVSYDTFFYPLDAIHNWNRIYGKRGFTQYQFVIPKESATHGLPKILKTIAASGQGSFLAVLKLFGKEPAFTGNISFPMEGYTLALDFPIKERLFPILDRLDAMVLDYGGRHYLSKDSRLPEKVFRRAYAREIDAFLAVKRRLDPEGIFASIQSRRLGIGV